MPKAYEMYYIDDRGEEHELGTFIEEPMEEEELRARMQAWIARYHGEEEARKWLYYSPKWHIG